MGFENVESIFIDDKEVQSIVVKDSGGILFQKSIDITNLPIMTLTVTGSSFSTYEYSSAPLRYNGRVFVDWGDDTGLIEYTGGKLTHTYSSSDNYTVKIYGDITSLGSSCFRNCTGLTSITLSNSITSLGDYCFDSCTGLTSITIPNSVTSLGSNCFYKCAGLTSINIPNSVTSLGDYCFSRCTGLTSITLPDNVTSLGEGCFLMCTGLTSIVIPDSVTSLGESCFGYCTSLTSINIPSNVTSLGGYCFNICANLTSIVIPDSVTSLGERCFDSSGLTSINIPSSVTSLGDYCFSRCTGLTSIKLNWDTSTNIPTYNSNWITTNANGYPLFHIPSSTTSLYTAKGYPLEKLEEKLSDNIMELEITGDSFSTYSSTPFTYTSSKVFVDWGDDTGLIEYTGGQLTHTYSSSDDYTVKIYGDITSLENECFRVCAGLTSITIPNNVTNLGSDCFRGCTGLTSINIPSGVTTLEDYCFFGCESLTSISIPNSVTSLGTSCFLGCTSLTSIEIPSSVTNLEGSCFTGCNSLTSIEIPSSVTFIGGYCFANCYALTSIKLNWSTSTNILTYSFNWINNTNQNLLFHIPNNTTSLYTAKGYPLEKLEETDVVFVGEGITTGWYDGQSFTIQNVSLENGKVKWTVPSSNKYLGYYTDNTQNIAGKTLCTTVKVSSVKNVRLTVYAYTDAWSNVNNILIPSGEDEVTIYTRIPFNASKVWVRLQANSSADNLNQGDIVYVEKWRTYLVDYLFKDVGTVENYTNSIWNISANLQINRLEEYTELIESTIGTTGSINTNTATPIPPNSVIEFDFMQVDGAKTQTPIYLRNSAGGVSLGWFSLNQINCNVGEWIHLKIIIEDTTSYKIYIDDNPTPITRTLSQTDTLYRLYFSTNGDITQLRYKNLVCCPLYEYLFKYEGLGGTEGANFIGTDNRVTVETTSSGTSLTGVTGFYVYWANVPQTSDDAFDFAGDTIIEFDVVEIANNGGAVLQIYDNDDTHIYFNKKLRDDMGVTGACHIKITVIDNLVTVYRDGNIVDSCTTQMTLTDSYRIGFRGYEGWNFKFKNFTVMKPLSSTYDGVSLSIDKSTLSYTDSETCTLTAKLLRSRSNPSNVSGVTVEFFNGYTSLGTAITNSYGVATKTYSSSGAGVVSFTARVGTFVSETYSIFDCIAYNKETSASDFLTYWNSTNNNANTITVDDNGTLIETDASKHSSTYMQLWLKSFSNYMNVPLCYEIEIVENTNYVFSFPIKITDGTTLWWNSSVGATGKLRVEIDSEKAIYYLNDVKQWGTTSSQIPTQSRCYLQSVRANGNGSIKYKNFKIYNLNSISLVASQSILSYADSDSTTLTATHLLGTGKTVKLYNASDESLIGVMTDNEDGTYSYTYNSQGIGDLTVYASDGNIISEDILIEDCLYYSSPASTNAIIAPWTNNCIVEYEVYASDRWNWHYLVVFQEENQEHIATLSTSYDNSSQYPITTTYFPAQNTWTPIQFKTENGTATVSSNGTVKGTTNISLSDLTSIKIYNSKSTTQQRNIKIKPLTPISLVASQSILSYADSDSTTLTATHLLGTGKTVKLYNASDESLIGVMTDNGDGTYSYTYNSQGIGELSVYASDGNLSSEIYAITDCIYYDDMSSDTNRNYFVNSADGTSISYDSTQEALKITCGSNVSRNYVQLMSSNQALDLNEIKSKTVRFKVNVFGLDGKEVRLDAWDNATNLGRNEYSSTDGERYIDVAIPSNPSTPVLFRITANASQTALWVQNATYFFKDFTIYPMYDDINLTADKSILSFADNESATLTAQLTNNGSPARVSGVTVEFFNGSTSIGTAVTNSSGIATKTYASAGAGDLSFTASVGTISSEIYSILDASFYDKATEGAKNSNWSNYNNNITVVTSTSYTTLTPGIDNNQNRYIVPSDTIPVEPFVIDFKKHNTAVNGLYLMIGSRAINLYSLWNGHLKDAYHIKFTVDNGEIKCEHDGTIEQSVTTYTSLTNGVQFRFNNLASGLLQYSDFMIYPINSISLVASESVLSYADGDSTVLTATHSLGAGKTVKLYDASDDTLIGAMTDNEDGTYSYTYNSQAIGDLTLYASDGNLLSETYEILDCYYYETIPNGVLRQGIISHQNIGRSSIAISDEWSTIGDYSIKVTSTQWGWGAYRINNPLITKKGTIKLDCKNTGGSVGYYAYIFIGGSQYSVNVIKATDFEGTIELDYDFTDKEGNITMIDIRGVSRDNNTATIYLDNIRIYPINSISLVASESVLSYADGDSTVLTATHSLGTGKTVKLYNTDDDSLIGTMTDNEDGTYSYTYTSQGIGELSVYATDGKLSSETFVLIDGLFTDIGTSTNYGTWTSSDFTGTKISRNSEYTTLTPEDNFDAQYQTISSTDLCIECDVYIDFIGTSNVFSFRQNSTSKVAFDIANNLGLTSQTWHHLKFIVSDGTITSTVDNVSKTGKSLSDTINRFYIVLDNTKESSMRYKNLVIYPV